MKNLFFILCGVLFVFYSCNRQNKIKELPCEKIYTVEWNWTLSEEDNNFYFRVPGFSELDKKLNLHTAYQSIDSLYGTFNSIIADSLKDKILNIIDKYPTDTTFLYKGKGRIYDGNYYIFIFQKNDTSFTRIYFLPEFLPQDLLFLYNHLYTDREDYMDRKNDGLYIDTLKKIPQIQYMELFQRFKNVIHSSGVVVLPPPPMLKSTIQFTPPVIEKKKNNRNR
jgi:hypothetical protein